MSVDKRLSKVYKSSECINLPDSIPVVIFSDCHRGCGNNSDNFAPNKTLYMAALRHYFERGYIYIELGDCDELWENRRIDDIIAANEDVFELLSCFYRYGKLFMLYGNHDMTKHRPDFAEKWLYQYYDKCRKKYIELFPGISIREGLKIRDCSSDTEFFLVHGHQGDPINDSFWKLGRFLVRYFWRPLELFGVKDPFSTSLNCNKHTKLTEKYISWAKRENKNIIVGHTHQPAVEKFREGVDTVTSIPELMSDNDPVPNAMQQSHASYYNSGSCVRAGYITALELCNGRVSLVKWQMKTDRNNRLYVGRDTL